MSAARRAPPAPPIPLPAGAKKEDLLRPPPGSKDRVLATVELWCVEFRGGELGWVAPALHIANARRGQPRRVYATRVPEGSLCRVGHGPHVKGSVTIVVKQSSSERLSPLLALRLKGEIEANQVRDRISSRRAQGQVMRSQGLRSWRWDL